MIPGGTPASPGREEDRVHPAMAYLPFVLLGLSLTFTLTAGAGARLPWVIAVTAVTVAFRVWWLLDCAAPPLRTVGFALNLVLTLVLISLSPLYGVYAFVGYLDAVAVLSGTAQVWGLVAAASLNALAQSGGPQGAYQQPWLFAFLLLANAGLAVIMVQVDRHRQLTVTQLRQALSSLEEAHRVNQQLQDQLVDQARASGVLEERQRLSREIHDTVAQGLIALLRQIEAAGDATTLPQARAVLDRADRTARDSLDEARRAVAALASPWLDEADLAEAVENLLSAWSQDSSIAHRLHVSGTPSSTTWDADLMRVCQEGLANVAKHSHADLVEVSLAYTDKALTLTLSDDGVGFDGQPGLDGHGLPSMRQRLHAAGGELTVSSTGGTGCVVRAMIPR